MYKNGSNEYHIARNGCFDHCFEENISDNPSEKSKQKFTVCEQFWCRETGRRQVYIKVGLDQNYFIIICYETFLSQQRDDISSETHKKLYKKFKNCEQMK